MADSPVTRDPPVDGRPPWPSPVSLQVIGKGTCGEFFVELGVRNATDELHAYEEGFFEAGRSWLGRMGYRF